MIDLKDKIAELREYFLKQPEIMMAFAFGSYVKGTQTSESDFDIAIYFKPEGRLLEWEEEKTYPDEDKIWGDVEKIIGINTDCVVLNRAPAELADSIILDGTSIIIKDRALYLRFLLTITSAAEDFREFVQDFWEIKERSHSLSEADKTRLIRVIDFLKSELADCYKFIDISQKSYETSPSLRREVERWTENIVNSAIDIAKILLASEKKKIPHTYKEILSELSQLENFNEEIAKKLAQFSKLRNILAHEYLDIRFANIKSFLCEVEPLYTELIEFTKTTIKN